MNNITLIGRLTADPELRYTNSGVAVTTFTLAVDRERKNQAGERETDFVPIVVWQKAAELCAQYLRKGRLAGVTGRIQIRKYENREGQKMRVAEVVATNVQFLDKAPTTAEPDTTPAPRPSTYTPPSAAAASDPFADDGDVVDITDDDLPF